MVVGIEGRAPPQSAMLDCFFINLMLKGNLQYRFVSCEPKIKI